MAIEEETWQNRLNLMQGRYKVMATGMGSYSDHEVVKPYHDQYAELSLA